MRGTTCGLIAVLLLCGAGMSCAEAPGAQAANFDFGDWWGGFGLIDGDRLHWSHFSATLRAGGRGLVGDGMYLVGPDKDRGLDGTMAISGKFRGERLKLRLSYGGKRLDCDAAYDTESIAGTCDIKGDKLTLRLVRVAPLDPAEVAAIQAVYQFEDGRRILIGQIGPLPMMLDLSAGHFRVLFPKGNKTWTAGPRLLVGYPEAWRLVFAEDALTLYRDGAAPERGQRRPGFQEEAFSFESEHDGITLSGTLTLPPGEGPHPAVVWVHGSGHTPRTEAQFFPRYMADLGFAMLAFDKRGVGASQGSYAMPNGATFSVPFLRRRAKDVVSAMNGLRSDSRIRSESVGLMGISQAGWVLPVAASSTDCSFTISMSGGATRLTQEDHFSQLTDESRSDASLRSVEDALARVRARAPQGHDWSADFATQRCPGLWLYGLNDRSNPSQLCIDVLEAVKSKHGKDFTIIQFPDGNHPLMRSKVGGREERLVLSQFVSGKFTSIETWLDDKGLMP